MSGDESRPEREPAGAPQDASAAEYVPPAVEDIDTTFEPAEVAAGMNSPIHLGVEESARWH